MNNKSAMIAFMDLLIVLLAFYLVISGLLMKQTQDLAKGNIVQKAEFVAILEWDRNSTNDIDIWVEDPKNGILFYRDKEVDLMTLDHDDQGMTKQPLVDANGNPLNPNRQEVASIRGIIPGKYTVNAVYFAKRTPEPVNVRVQVIKLNPYSVIIDKQILMTQEGEERTVVQFTLDDVGNVINVDKTDFRSLLIK